MEEEGNSNICEVGILLSSLAQASKVMLCLIADSGSALARMLSVCSGL
jgi:hypothetical protein